MSWIASFWRQPNKRYRNFVIVYFLLALNFIIPALVYYFDPDAAIESFYDIGRRFDFGQPVSEDSYIWWILGAGNVMTLGVMCSLLLVNLRYFLPILPVLVTLKGLSSLGFLAVFVFGPRNPTFLGAALLDGVTVFLMIWFAVRAQRSIGIDPDGLVPLPVDGKRVLRVGPRSRERIATVAARLAPPGASEKLPQGAASTEVVDAIVGQVGAAPLAAGITFRIAFAFVNAAPTVVIGRLRTLKGLNQEQSSRYLVKLERSRIYPIRQLLFTVKVVVGMALMGERENQAGIGAYRSL